MAGSGRCLVVENMCHTVTEKCAHIDAREKLLSGPGSDRSKLAHPLGPLPAHRANQNDQSEEPTRHVHPRCGVSEVPEGDQPQPETTDEQVPSEHQHSTDTGNPKQRGDCDAVGTPLCRFETRTSKDSA